jgi:hypothetical protein
MISKFGLGMVIFPCILSNLGGDAKVKYVDPVLSETLSKYTFSDLDYD